MLKRQADCCKYQEDIKKLGRTSKKRVKRAKKNGGDDECEDIDEEKVPCGSLKKIIRGSEFTQKNVSQIDEIVGRIKPGISIREKYSLSRHIRCISEDDASHLEEKNKSSTITKKKWKQEKSTNMSKREMHQDGSTGHLRTKKERDGGSKKFRNLRIKEDHKQQGNKHQTWSICASDESEGESECDEVCSFDSEVDLAGIALTADDRKKIAENIKSIQETATTSNDKK